MILTALVLMGCDPELRSSPQWMPVAERLGEPCRVEDPSEPVPTVPGRTARLFYCGTPTGDIDRRHADGSPVCYTGCRELVQVVVEGGTIDAPQWVR